MKKIYIFDTTLRDGEQTPGVALNPQEKLEIAKKLKKEGMNTELIAEITGLKIKEIAEI